ncbi:Ig-like domain-containing protein [Microbacterium tumbae]
MADNPQPGHRSSRRIGSVFIVGGLVAGSLIIGAPAAQAAVDTITVTSLGLGGNLVAGDCEASSGAGDCTLRGALEIANASTNPDGVEIVFDPALSGAGELSVTGGGGSSMSTERVGNGTGNLAGAIGPNGARFVVDSVVPVSIDFTNLDGIADVDGSGAATILVASDDVRLSNLANIVAAEAAIAISGSNVSIADVQAKDAETSNMEVGIALLDGAADIALTDVVVYSPYYTSFGVEAGATVSNVSITGAESRGVQAWAHVDIEDGATVDGFVVSNSVFGAAEEISPTHGYWMNPGVTATGLEFVDSEFHSPRQNLFFFEGGAQTLTGTAITGNDISGTGDGVRGFDAGNISRVIGDNTARWDDLVFARNTIDEAQAVKFGGSVSNATFADNTFTNINDGSFAALHLGNELDGIVVSGNSFDDIWAVDTIRVEGTSATDVVIEDNTLENLTASVSRSAIRIDVAGSGNIVRDNTLTQDIADSSLPADIDNHWAIYNSANASDVTTPVGWSIVRNAIDGFGGKDRSQAPVVHNARGILDVVGNTFGPSTRGGVTTDVEHSAYWFLWNVGDSVSNDTVQTFRVGEPSFDGENATFTAVQPDPLIGNNPATGPVTLHVYWTAADNAEEYLGAIEDVDADDVVTIPTTHTDGFLRLQTVDANGFVSQYSSLDPEAPSVVPAAPLVVSVTEDAVEGTGTAGATVEIRTADGDVTATAEVDENGAWTVPADLLVCGTVYTAVQIVDGVEGDATEFATVACDTDAEASADADADGGSSAADDTDADADGGAADADGTGDGELATTGGGAPIGLALLAMLTVAAGAGLVVLRRRRQLS